MIEGDIGSNMLKECQTTVSQRSFSITVQGDTGVETDQRKDGRKAITPKAKTNWMNSVHLKD